MQESQVLLKSEADSENFAQSLSAMIKSPQVIALSGDLGSGKTFIARAFIQALCGAETVVSSPTFNLLQIYDCSSGNKIYHYDLYRLKDLNEAYELGIEEAMEQYICLIEWPEIINLLLPPRTIYINLQIENSGVRACSLKLDP